MISKNQIKFVKSLQQKKFRKETGLFVVEGKKMVSELLASNWKVDKIILMQGESLPDIDSEDIWEASEKDMERMSSMKTAPEVLAVVHQNGLQKEDVLTKSCLVLDGIKDPGNFGAILRSADWFGIEHVVCSKDSVELFNPKTVQSTMGSLFRIHVTYTNLGEFLKSYKKNKGIVMGTMMKGKNIFHTVFPPTVAIVIGSESHGIRPQTSDLLDEIVTIPGGQETESLNASVAAGIACSEWYRRQNHP